MWPMMQTTEAPPSDISTKRIKLEEKGREEKLQRGEGVESKDGVTWPEPQKCVPPPVRTAVVIPEDVASPEGCKRFSLSEHADSLSAEEDFDDDAVMSSLTALVGKMENNEICNGLALVGDISMAMAPVIRHATALKQRVLVVCVGGTGVLSHLPEDGTALAVHVSKEAPEEPQLKHYIPVRLKNGCGHTSGLAQATCGLLLPLAYEYDPALVLLARMPGTDGASDCAWQQLVGLLQGLARGRMLVLIQRDDKALVSPTSASLSGSPLPCLGRLPAPLAEDVEALERLRRRLQVDWLLLRTSAQKSGGEDN